MKLKKIAALALSTFFYINSISFIYADELKVLTVDSAVEQAIKYSKTLKNYAEENDVNDLEITSTKLNLMSSGETEQIISLAIQLKELYAKAESNALSAEDEKKSIEYSVYSFFIDIIKAENNLELYKEEVALKEKQLKISKTKFDYGRLSQSDYENEQLEYKNLLKQIEDLQNTIDNAYISLNKVLGVDLATKYKLDLGTEITYTPIGNVDLESKITQAISINNGIKTQKNTVDIANYSLNSFISGVNGNTRAAKIAAYNKATRTLDDLETSLRESITKNYNEIIKNENEYNSNLLELENMNKQLKIKELNLKLGKATEIEVEQYKYDIKVLENTIKEQIYDHDLLTLKFENPNLL